MTTRDTPQASMLTRLEDEIAFSEKGEFAFTSVENELLKTLIAGYRAHLSAGGWRDKTYDVEERRMKGCCLDCGRKYGDEYGFPDLLVPNDVWLKISPTGDEGGLLCPSCMCRRAVDAGLEHVEARFVSGGR